MLLFSVRPVQISGGNRFSPLKRFSFLTILGVIKNQDPSPLFCKAILLSKLPGGYTPNMGPKTLKMGDFQWDTLASVIKRPHAVQITGLFKNLIWTTLIYEVIDLGVKD